MKDAGGIKRQAWGTGRAAFHALAAPIFKDLENRLPMTVVYQRYRDRLKVGYRQFNRLVHGHESQMEPVKTAPWAAQTPAKPAPEAALPTIHDPMASRSSPVREAPGGGHGQRQFHYDSTINKDELI